MLEEILIHAGSSSLYKNPKSQKFDPLNYSKKTVNVENVGVWRTLIFITLRRSSNKQCYINLIPAMWKISYENVKAKQMRCKIVDKLWSELCKNKNMHLGEGRETIPKG